MVLLPGNTMELTIYGVEVGPPESWVTSATTFEVVEVLDEVDDQVTGGPGWPVGLAYKAGSNGDWNAFLDDALNVDADQVYKIKVLFENGP